MLSRADWTVAVHCRVKHSITSPAYVDISHTLSSSDTSTVKSVANEVLAKMLARDKCDITKISPLYDFADLQFKSPVSSRVISYVEFVIVCCSIVVGDSIL